MVVEVKGHRCAWCTTKVYCGHSDGDGDVALSSSRPPRKSRWWYFRVSSSDHVPVYKQDNGNYFLLNLLEVSKFFVMAIRLILA